jgi:hypothetical protein
VIVPASEVDDEGDDFGPVGVPQSLDATPGCHRNPGGKRRIGNEDDVIGELHREGTQ